MDVVVRLLREFPAIWIVVGAFGAIVGATFWYLTFGKKLNPMFGKAIDDITKLHEAQIASHERTLKMQKDHYSEEIADIKAERDKYRESLHKERNDHQECKNRIIELEARPNVESVSKSQREFFPVLISTMQEMHTALIKHDQSIERRTAEIIEPIRTMCQSVVTALNGKKIIDK
jgi:hypothetical protein